MSAPSPTCRSSHRVLTRRRAADALEQAPAWALEEARAAARADTEVALDGMPESAERAGRPTATGDGRWEGGGEVFGREDVPEGHVHVPVVPVHVPEVHSTVHEVPVSMHEALLHVPEVFVPVPEVPVSVPEVPAPVAEVPAPVPEVRAPVLDVPVSMHAPVLERDVPMCEPRGRDASMRDLPAHEVSSTHLPLPGVLVPEARVSESPTAELPVLEEPELRAPKAPMNGLPVHRPPVAMLPVSVVAMAEETVPAEGALEETLPDDPVTEDLVSEEPMSMALSSEVRDEDGMWMHGNGSIEVFAANGDEGVSGGDVEAEASAMLGSGKNCSAPEGSTDPEVEPVNCASPGAIDSGPDVRQNLDRDGAVIVGGDGGCAEMSGTSSETFKPGNAKLAEIEVGESTAPAACVSAAANVLPSIVNSDAARASQLDATNDRYIAMDARNVDSMSTSELGGLVTPLDVPGIADLEGEKKRSLTASPKSDESTACDDRACGRSKADECADECAAGEALAIATPNSDGSVASEGAAEVIEPDAAASPAVGGEAPVVLRLLLRSRGRGRPSQRGLTRQGRAGARLDGDNSVLDPSPKPKKAIARLRGKVGRVKRARVVHEESDDGSASAPVEDIVVAVTRTKPPEVIGVAGRPKRMRKNKQPYGESNTILPSDTQARTARASKQTPSNKSGAAKAAAAVPKRSKQKYRGQRLSAELRAELAALGDSDRVTMIQRDGKLLAGQSAPMRKNMDLFFQREENAGYRIFDKFGVHRERRQAVEKKPRGTKRKRNARQTVAGGGDGGEAGDERRVDGDGDDDGDVAVKEVAPSNAPFGGQVLSPEAVEELAAMGDDDLVRLWNTQELRILGGLACPHRKNLDAFLRRNPVYEVFDGQEPGRGALRGRRDKSRDRDRTRSRHGKPAVDSLAKAKNVAVQKADQLRTDVYVVMGSLRTGDPVAELRLQLEKEIERSRGLEKLIENMRESKYLELASTVLTELEELDVYDVFAPSDEDSAYGLPAIAEVRDLLEGGALDGVSAVWKQFCHVLAFHIDFFGDGCLPFVFAERLAYDGSRVVKQYFEDYPGLAAEESLLSRMRHICDLAFERVSKTGVNLAEAVSQRIEELDPEAITVANPLLVVDDGGQREKVVINERRTIVRQKFNFRDEKGYSHLGKQQSAKVLSLALYRPGFDGQLVTAQNYGGRQKNDSVCHCCFRELDDAASRALSCSNRLYGLCSKLFCFQCVVTKFNQSDDDFVQLRAADVWMCFHCRGKCPKRHHCKRSNALEHSGESDEISKRPILYQIQWPRQNDEGSQYCFEVAIAERRLDGTYGDFGQLICCVAMLLREDTTIWIANGSATVGAYRCKIVRDGVWFASFCFQLLPPTRPVPDHNAMSLSGRGSSPSHVDSHPYSLSSVVDETEMLGLQERCSIRWSVADTRASASDHNDIPVSLAGIPVRACSRTEGYDWRAAKLYPTVTWVGSVRRRGPTRRDAAGESMYRIVSRCAVISDVPLRRGLPPGIRPGMSLQAYDIVRNTAMYDIMQSQQWNIVTGKSAIHGIGIFTMTGYSKGDFIIEYAGQLIRHQVGDLREVHYTAAGLGTYLFRLNDEQIVDATMKSNRARFLNHSCDPNLESSIVSLEGRDVVIFVATRAIPPLAELTFDYKLPLEETKLTCRCSSTRCPGVMN